MPLNDDCPPGIIEVRRNDDGTLDEIVAGTGGGWLGRLLPHRQ